MNYQCPICGALTKAEDEQLHREWHKALRSYIIGAGVGFPLSALQGPRMGDV